MLAVIEVGRTAASHSCRT